MSDPSLEVPDAGGPDRAGRVPPPLPPEDPDAWYAEDVRAQRAVHRLATLTDRSVEAVEAEFRRKHRYVEYCCLEDVSDFEDLFAFLADLQTDEAATVERIQGTRNRTQ